MPSGIPRSSFVPHSGTFPVLGADNLIPMELALKIVSKIRAKERFSVYIVIPMWPEGIPTGAAVQEILFWQGQTMTMMYGIIGKTLQKGLSESNHLQDYLNFYCLGKREPMVQEKSSTTSNSSKNSTLICSKKEKLHTLLSLLQRDAPKSGIIFVSEQSEKSKRAGKLPSATLVMEFLKASYSGSLEVLLLEGDMNFNACATSLFAWKLWKEGRGLELMDGSISSSYSASEVLRCVQVGLLCVQEQASDRPFMSAVSMMLGSESASLLEPNEPGFSIGRAPVDTESSSAHSVNEVTLTMINCR